jgi:hypothetical protein
MTARVGVPVNHPLSTYIPCLPLGLLVQELLADGTTGGILCDIGMPVIHRGEGTLHAYARCRLGS